MVDLNHINMVHKTSSLLAPALGLKVREVGNQASHLQTLSLYSKRKVKKEVLFTVPPEFSSRDQELHNKKAPKDLVPPQSKRIFRLDPEHWAPLVTERVPDKELLARSAYVQKVSKKGQPVFSLQKSHSANRAVDFQRVASAASHSFRLASVSAVLSQFVLEETSHLTKDLQNVLSPVIQQRLDRIMSAAQLGVAAASESSEIASRTRVFAAHKERDVWLDNSRLSNALVKEAKSLPLPRGSLDSEGVCQMPLFLGPQFVQAIDEKYKSIKHMDKVAPDRKRQSSQGGNASKKQKTSQSSSKGGKTSNYSFRAQSNQGANRPSAANSQPGFQRAKRGNQGSRRGRSQPRGSKSRGGPQK